MKKKTPLLIIASETPNNNNGSGVIINRLLSNFGASELVYLARKAAPKGRIKVSYPVYVIPSPPVDSPGERFWQMLSIIPGVVMGLYLLLKYKPKAIVAFFPYENALLISYILHKLTGIRYFPYLNDLYQENRSDFRAKIAAWLQPRLFKKAAGIIVVNDGMKRFYEEKYGLESYAIFTSINEAVPEHLKAKPLKNVLTIGYSGNINKDRLDAFQSLMLVTGNKPEYNIRIFSSNSREQLEKMGVWAENVSLSFINDAAKLIEELGKCDLLYLPLTFSTDHNSLEQLSTCLGIKSYEYLMSGVPVLVHCPSGYYTAQFYQERNCGIVSSSLDAAAVEHTLNEARNGKFDLQQLIDNSLKAAQSFQGKANAEKLRNLVDA